MQKPIITVTILCIISLTLYGCSGQKTVPKDNNVSITIYTSIYPLYDFAKKIGQEKVTVNLIVPPGAEPHDWEPSAKLISKMEQADILVYNGLGMELWAEKIIDAINHPDLVIVNASDNVELLELGENEHTHNDDLHNEDEVYDKNEPKHGIFDPHIWLDPIRAITQAENIKNALIEVDSSNRGFYENNYMELKSNLLKLDEKYRNTLSLLPRNEIVVSHAAFGYMANRYDLNQLSISGLSPQSEPSPAEMSKLTNFIKEHHIKYIFYENLSNPKLAQVIANETEAKTLSLNPLGSLTQEELDEGNDYFTIMEENLISLKQALSE